MKTQINLLILFFLSLALSSCEFVGTIFKGGVWTGVIMVVAVLGLILWLVAKFFGGGK
ncbi:hypothetical protein CLV98_104288 [Dyadobacter jejuensis]|uniref:Phosphatidate cytidylyltransferase n=1 Tax=Dyadobacter jejuensis TaxID=1082580 RepID=A0A316AMB5_9BACT|nr:hypothetical protein [Dyadobacter jejuensis]PWJ58429.1 hypothetical protein CLV98_104288 [Dyadobacter jejuensis]